MQKRNLRITANFSDVISAQIKVATGQDNPALVNAIIIDDLANLVHEVAVKYDFDDDGNIYRRLNYVMTSMTSGKVIMATKNRMAQELLYKIATELTGSTLFRVDYENNSYINRNFDKSMFILGPNDGTWDDELPNDKPEPKRKRKQKQEANTEANTNEGDKNE